MAFCTFSGRNPLQKSIFRSRTAVCTGGVRIHDAVFAYTAFVNAASAQTVFSKKPFGKDGIFKKDVLWSCVRADNAAKVSLTKAALTQAAFANKIGKRIPTKTAFDKTSCLRRHFAVSGAQTSRLFSTTAP